MNRRRDMKRGRKQPSQAMLEEALYLLTVEKVPVARVCRRLRLRRGVAAKLLQSGVADRDVL